MTQYTNYCTVEQTKRAYELGAPIIKSFSDIKTAHIETEQDGNFYVTVPTTQQMRGWLMDKGLYIEIALNGECSYKLSVYISTEEDGELDIDIEASDSYKDLELAAIDATLDYLEKGERNE